MWRLMESTQVSLQLWAVISSGCRKLLPHPCLTDSQELEEEGYHRNVHPYALLVASVECVHGRLVMPA